MPKTIEIKMTPWGYDVTTGGNTTRFRQLDEAVDFARGRFERAQEIKALAASID